MPYTVIQLHGLIPVKLGMSLLVLVTHVLLMMILRLASNASGRLPLLPLLTRKWNVILLPDELPILVSMLLCFKWTSRLPGSPARMYIGTLHVNSGNLGIVVRTRWKRSLTLVMLFNVQNGVAVMTVVVFTL